MSLQRTQASLAALAILAAAGVAGAAEVAQSQPQAAPAVSANMEGKRAVRDPNTGKLRAPSQEEHDDIARSERATARSAAPASTAVEVRRHGNGMLSAVLGVEHMVSIQAQRRIDGKLNITHAHPQQEHPTSAPQRPTE
jgi:hypothetical protein